MAYSRASVLELENLLKYGKKKFVRYEEGAKLYSMGLHSFQDPCHSVKSFRGINPRTKGQCCGLFHGLLTPFPLRK